MHTNKHTRFARLGLESLEGRALPSTVTAAPAPVIGQQAVTSPMQVTNQATPAAITTAPVAASFSYRVVPGPSAIVTGTNTKTANGRSTGSVALAMVRNRTGSAIVNGAATRVLAGYVTTSSSATPQDPDRYNATFSLRMEIRDASSGAIGFVTFSGRITGTLSWSSSGLRATIAGTAVNGQVTQRVTIGRNVYSVSLPQTFVPNGPYQAPVALYATVKVTPRV